jgi:hypothetical protein
VRAGGFSVPEPADSPGTAPEKGGTTRLRHTGRSLEVWKSPPEGEGSTRTASIPRIGRKRPILNPSIEGRSDFVKRRLAVATWGSTAGGVSPQRLRSSAGVGRSGSPGSRESRRNHHAPAQPKRTSTGERPREGPNHPANRNLFAAEVCTGICAALHESRRFAGVHAAHPVMPGRSRQVGRLS